MNPAFYEMELYLQAGVTRVWGALVEPELASRYHIAPLRKLETEPGGEVVYGSERAALITGRVLVCESPACLSHTFRFAGSEEETAVTYTLTENGENLTHLHLRHEGFAPESKIYDDIAGGWPTILSSLKTFLETGRPIAWP